MFRYSGPVFDFMNRLVDLIILSLLWLIMCIPIFTIGASTTAAYYVAFSFVNEKDGYVVKKFFKSFKENFVISTKLFLIVGSLSFFSMFNLSLLYENVMLFVDYRFLRMGIVISQLIILFEASIFGYFGYSLLSKIEFTFKDLLYTVLIVGNRNFLYGLGNFGLIVALYILALEFPITLLFIFGLYFYLSAKLLKGVIVKYRPEIFEPLKIDDDSFRIDSTNEEENVSTLDILNEKEQASEK